MVASSSDNAITSKFQKACETFDITLLDHIILSDTGYLSYRRRRDALTASFTANPAILPPHVRQAETLL